MFITKKDLIKAVSKDLGKTEVEVYNTIHTFFDKIKENLIDSKSIRMNGLVSFKVVNRKAMLKRNPKTGASVNVPAKKVVKVKCGSFFKI